MPAETLGRRVTDGLRWSLLNNVVTRLGTVLTGLVLARLLSPENYGVYAVALVALNALLSLNELGVSLAVVRWPGDVRAIAPTVMTISMLSSSAFYLLCLVLAGPLAAALHAPSAAGVVRLLCLNVVLDGIATVPAGLLTREFLQGRRFVLDLVNFGLGTGVTLVLAEGGGGAASLAWGRVVGNLAAIALLAAWSPRWLRPGWDAAQVRPLLAFGVPLAASSLLVFAMLNADYVVVGRVLGPVALGYYLLAFNLSSWPVTLLSQAVRRVALAGFSRLADDRPALWAGFSRSMVLLMVVTIPMCVLLSVFAPGLIAVLYGHRWGPAARALEFLAFLGGIRVAAELAYDLLVALGRSRDTMRLQALWVVVLVPALYLCTRVGGIRGTSVAHVAVGCLVVLPAFVLALRRSGLRVRPLAAACVRPAVGGVVLGLLALASTRVLTGTLWQLAVGGLVAVAGYAVVALPVRRIARP